MTDSHLADREARLQTLLRAGLPPARDPLFRLEVLARRDRQRFQRQIAPMVAAAVAMALVALSAGAISTWLAADVTRIAGLIAVAATALWSLPGGSRLVSVALPRAIQVWVVHATRLVLR